MFYSNDSGINYYSCNNPLYNEVSNCIKCSNKNSCLQCDENYILVNDKASCIMQSSVDDKIVYYNKITEIYTQCSDLIHLCHKCSNEKTCIQCGAEGALVQDDTCINNSLVINNNYYKNETSQKYTSCSIIDNCFKCLSDTECILCQEGFELDNNDRCIRISYDEDSGLSTAAIIGIIFGCIGAILIAGVIIYFLFKKTKIQNVPEIQNEEKIEEKEEKIAGTERIYIKSIKNINKPASTFS